MFISPCQPILLVFAGKVLAQVPQAAPRAVRLARVAHAPAVQDHPQAELSPFFGGEQRVELHLHFHGVLVAGEPETFRQSQHVRVDGKPGQPERGAAQHPPLQSRS